ncbi:hypothetical protein SMICM17S_09677 [Streptomyces microflavus]
MGAFRAVPGPVRCPLCSMCIHRVHSWPVLRARYRWGRSAAPLGRRTVLSVIKTAAGRPGLLDRAGRSPERHPGTARTSAVSGRPAARAGRRGSPGRRGTAGTVRTGRRSPRRRRGRDLPGCRPVHVPAPPLRPFVDPEGVARPGPRVAAVDTPLSAGRPDRVAALAGRARLEVPPEQRPVERPGLLGVVHPELEGGIHRPSRAPAVSAGAVRALRERARTLLPRYGGGRARAVPGGAARPCPACSVPGGRHPAVHGPLPVRRHPRTGQQEGR